MKRIITLVFAFLLLFNSSFCVNYAKAEEFNEEKVENQEEKIEQQEENSEVVEQQQNDDSLVQNETTDSVLETENSSTNNAEESLELEEVTVPPLVGATGGTGLSEQSEDAEPSYYSYLRKVTIESDANGNLLIRSNDDEWLNDLCENGYLLFREAVPQIKIESKNSNNIVKTHAENDVNDVYAFVSKEVLSNYNIYNGWQYIGMYAKTCAKYSDEGVTIINQKEDRNYPSDLEISENSNGNLEIKSADSNYLNSILKRDYVVSIYPCGDCNWGISNENLSLNGNTLTCDIDFCDYMNGTEINVNLYPYGYETFSKSLTLKNQKTKACPDYDLSIDSSTGDLYISSTNKDWIANLLSESYDGHQNCLEIEYEDSLGHTSGIYVRNDSYESNRLKSVNENTVVYTAEQQKARNGYVTTSNEYDVYVRVADFVDTPATKITFTNASSQLPSDVKCIMGDSYIYITSSNDDFINSINYINIGYIYNGYYRASGYLNLDSQKVKYQTNMLIIPKESFEQNLKDTMDEYECEFDDYYFYFDTDGKYSCVDPIKLVKEIDTTVTFDSNGGTGSMSGVNKYGYYELPDCLFTAPNGKEFLGWQVNDEETIRFAKEEIFIGGTTTIKALWKDIPTPRQNIKDSDLSANKLNMLTNVSDNTLKASFTSDILESSIGLTAEEKNKGAAVWLEASPIEITDTGYKQLSRAIALESGGSLLSCLDINIFKKVKGKDTEKVSETNNKVTVSLYIGDDENLMSLAKNGKLVIYSVHNGRVSSIIKGSYNEETKIFSFETNEFSAFALATDYSKDIEDFWNNLDKEAKTIDIPSFITEIPDEGFAYFYNLEAIIIPDTVKTIGQRAFAGCYNLNYIYIPSTIESIGGSNYYNSAFCGCNDIEIYTNAEGKPDAWNSKWNAIDYNEYANVVYGSSKETITKIINFWSSLDDNVKTIEVPNYIKSIPNRAFEFFGNLQSIVLPDSIVTIGDYAFSYCYNLKTINIPSSVTSISYNAFYCCDNLSSITVDSNNKVYDSRDNCNAIIEKASNVLVAGCKNTIIPNTVKEIGVAAFESCQGLKTIEIPSSVTTIESVAFYNCDNLTSINIPSSVTSISNSAFRACDNLKTITVDSGNAIYDSRNNCNAIITKLDNKLIITCPNSTIPSGVEIIGSYAFEGVYGIKSITMPNTVKTIEEFAFSDCNDLETLIIPESVTLIDNYAFNNDSKLKAIFIPSSVTTIKADNMYDGPFANLNSLTIYTDASSKQSGWGEYWDYLDNGNKIKVVYNTNKSVVENIGNFWNDLDKSATTIEIPECITSIPEYAFQNFYNLETIKIPNTVVSIGSYAFADCYNLKSITIPKTVTSIGNNILYDCNSLEEIKVESGNTIYNSGNNDNVIIETASNTLIVGCQNSSIPSGVTSIGENAFYSCNNLKSIIIPNSVETIKYNAFYNCDSLTSINIPSSVTSISNSAFRSCDSLKTITVDTGNTVYDSRNNCNAIIKKTDNELIIGCQSTIIPETVTSIGNYAFCDCENLKSISIPDSVIYLGDSALGGCYNLKSVYLPKTITTIEADYDYNSPFYNNNNLTIYTDATSKLANWGKYWNYIGYNTKADVVYSTSRESFTAINDFWNNLDSNATTIEIPSGITCIPENAFSSFEKLETIIIPNTVTSVGEYAFYDCYNLKTINIPSSVVSIGYNAFYYCNNLSSITVDSNNKVYDSRDNCNAIIEIKTNTLIQGCQNTVIPNTVVEIGNDAFAHQTKLTSISIPSSVTTIDSYAFNDCALESLSIPSTVSYIDSTAFMTNNYLKSIKVDSANKVYDSRNNCNAIIETKTNKLIYGCNVSTIPNTVTTIGEYAFFFCQNLKSLSIPDSVTSIENFAFEHCYNLKYVFIPSSVKTIEADSGYQSPFCCDNTTTIYTNASKKQSGWDEYWNYVDDETEANVVYNTSRSTFNNIVNFWDNLDRSATSITIPNYITEIPEFAFYNFSKLETVNIPNTVTTIGNNAFFLCENLQSINIPSSVNSIGDGAFCECDSLSSIKVDSANKIYDSRDNCNAIIEKASNKLIIGCKNTTIPSTVVEIGEMAFNRLSNLSSITIPNGVKTIDSYAFYYCGLTSIVIPNSVTSIDKEAFYGTNLESISVANGNTKYDSRNNCNAIIEKESNKLIIGCKNTTIPNTIKTIGENAFSDCQDLKAITIPSSVTKIEKGSFDGCGLSTIFIPSTVETITVEVDSEWSPFINDHSLTIFTDASKDLAGWQTGWNNTSSDAKAPVVYNSTQEEADQVANYWNNIDKNITSIDIPSYIKALPYGILEKYVYLQSVNIPSSVTTISEGVFANCQALKTITVDSGNIKYDSRDNCNAVIEKQTNELIAGCQKTVIPNTVTSIGSNAFYSCSHLRTIIIPNSVKVIKKNAFEFCSNLAAIYLPSSIETIETSYGYGPYCESEKLTIYTNTNSDSINWDFGWNRKRPIWYSDTECTSENIEVVYNVSLEQFKQLGIESEIIYHLDNGLNSYSNPDTYTAKDDLINLGNAIKEGYKFLGWYKEDTFKNRVFSIKGSSSGTVELYAKFEIGEAKTAELTDRIEEVLYVNGQRKRINDDYETIDIDADKGVITSYETANEELDDVHTQYPKSMQVWILEKQEDGSTKAVYHDSFDDILTYAGASIRITGVKGIRIITSIPTEKKNKLINEGIDGYKVMEYGTVMCWADTLASGEEPSLYYDSATKTFKATHGAKGRAYSRTANINTYYSEKDGVTKYTNTLVDTKGTWNNASCAKDFAMRSYMILRPSDATDDSKDIVVYGGTLYRSISYVAYQNRNYFNPSKYPNAYAYIWTLIRNGYGNIYDSEYKGA